ncbi:AraC family transcriptional regulator [Polaribacter sp. MSW13]|uniref:AraC family transcriptional regulator n=1 Tax=Polaribacter marinus TaxID=2916838 RepID=A0A9X1VTB1_9FLAO|nr:AraC family transcriptional regulator [Polaribacter marinus]MCI2229006.1 AraC family transcriptional regulator [Polaribacter marinus]
MNNTSKILGQKIIALPKAVIKNLEQNLLTNRFYVSDLGFYPEADNHYRINEKGVDKYIFIYCVKGKGSVVINGKRQRIEPNQFCIIPKNVKYEFKSDELDPWSIYWFYYSGALAPELYNRYKLTKYKYVPYSVDRIQVFEKVFNLFNGNNQDHLLEYASLLCLSFIGDFIYCDLDKNSSVKKEETLVDSIKKFLLNNLDKKFSLEEIAKKYNYSKSHLQVKFKKETGYPLHVFFNLKKIQKACEYLSYTELSVKEISFKVGIEDPLYFSRLFKNFMGKSPTSYRKEDDSK